MGFEFSVQDVILTYYENIDIGSASINISTVCQYKIIHTELNVSNCIILLYTKSPMTTDEIYKKHTISKYKIYYRDTRFIVCVCFLNNISTTVTQIQNVMQTRLQNSFDVRMGQLRRSVQRK